MTTHARRHSLLLLSFACIYLVWGTSFAATKFMVLGLPPFLAGAARFAVAGVLLGLLAAALGQPLPRRARDWWHVLVMALFQVVASSGGNALAMRHIASNQSALLNASSALWIPLVGALGARGHPLTLRVGAGIGIGLAGLGLLLWPRQGFSVADFGWQLLAVGACLAWALGTLYYRGIRTTVPMLMFLGAEMLVGGAVLAATGLGLGEGPEWRNDPTGLAALAFLMLFSSCLAYTAFGYLMVHTTPARLSTYAYVNPVIAALTGWWLLGERMSVTQLAGTGIILVGVVIVSLPDSIATSPAPPAEPTG